MLMAHVMEIEKSASLSTIFATEFSAQTTLTVLPLKNAVTIDVETKLVQQMLIVEILPYTSAIQTGQNVERKDATSLLLLQIAPT